MKRLVHLAVVLAALLGSGSCSTSTPARGGEADTSSGATPTPTPGVLSRVDASSVVEETETYVIHRLPKKNYIRIDDRHIRNPVISSPIEFFKEDEEYYYISTPRWTPEEIAATQATAGSGPAAIPPTPRPLPAGSPPKPSAAEFEDVNPPRGATRLKLQKVSSSGLPDAGMWRASFALADVNEDGKIDVVSPAPRVGDANLHIWLGDGRGNFSEWPITITENGAPSANFAIGYGGVAVGDIDGDGKQDIAVASHNGGLTSVLGNGNGEFRVVQKGLPGKDFSSQAIALLDVDGDRKLDIVASRDIMVQDSPSPGPSVRIYLYRGDGWQLKEDALPRGVISNSLHAWDFDGDGKKDILTGSHQFAALPLLWKNEGNSTFSPVKFDDFEVWAFHFATMPGTFGAQRVPAFADAFHLYTDEPKITRAIGINVYSLERGVWNRHRVWRHKEGKSAQYALALGDLDQDGLDDVAFADSEERRLRVFFQRADQSFEEMPTKDEPALDSPGQCIRFGDLDGDRRIDVVVAKTVSSTSPGDRGGWDVYLNRR